MSESETPQPQSAGAVVHFPAPTRAATVTFDRRELSELLNLYGRMVAAGEWRDYAIDFLKGKAVFAIFRRASEMPLYRVEKNPEAKQGPYAVINTAGLVLKRGHDLGRVLAVLEKPLKLVQ